MGRPKKKSAPVKVTKKRHRRTKAEMQAARETTVVMPTGVDREELIALSDGSKVPKSTFQAITLVERYFVEKYNDLANKHNMLGELVQKLSDSCEARFTALEANSTGTDSNIGVIIPSMGTSIPSEVSQNGKISESVDPLDIV